MPSRRLAGSFVAALAIASSAFAAEPKVEEKIVGPANAGGVYGISPRGVHIGYAATKGSRLAMTIDGVEGPVVDELFNPIGAGFYNAAQTATITAGSGGPNANTSVPIIFSADGEHSAYIGRQANEYVVFYDGKEIARGPRANLSLNYGAFTLSPGGKNVFFGEMNRPASGNATWRTVMNGKPGPWSGNQTMSPVFSPDDAHYAYTAVSVGDSKKFLLVVDGKEASYVAMNPIFTSDNRLLTTRPTDSNGKMAVLLDGKPVVSGLSVDKVVAAPAGGRYAAIVRTRLENSMGIPMLFVDGKEISGSDGARSVVFSPDGKHYAAVVANDAARAAFMLVDGKKGQEYTSVSETPVWTVDGSKIIYTVVSNGRNFVIVNGEEFPVDSLAGVLSKNLFPMPEKGARYAFATRDGMNRKFSVMIDGKQVLPDGYYPVDDTLKFTADGARYAYHVGPVGRNEITGLVVDGALVPDFYPNAFVKSVAQGNAPACYVFSPDGKQLVAIGRSSDQKKVGLFLNGKLAFRNQRGIFMPSFTPDSQHLFWTTFEQDTNGPQLHLTVYVDGTPTVQFKDNPFINTAGSYEMGRDGTLTFLTVSGNDVKRFRITAASDSTFASAIAAVDAADAKALADAEAAKKAAEEKAAQAKADKDAATAKAKADYDAAVAAKAQARADAAAAKKKAAEDAAAARKAKTGK